MTIKIKIYLMTKQLNIYSDRAIVIRAMILLLYMTNNAAVEVSTIFPSLN